MRMLTRLVVALVWTVVLSGITAQELLRNGEFNLALGRLNWLCNGCSGRVVNDAYSGKYAMLATRRTASWAGPWHPMGNKLVSGTVYALSGYVKVRPPKSGSDKPQSITVTLRHTLSDGSLEYQTVAALDNMTGKIGWKVIKGQFSIASFSKPAKFHTLYIEGPDAGRELLVDKFSLKRINAATTGNWITEANKRINNIRKSNLVVSIQSDKNLSSVNVQITQKTHEFAFGTAIDSTTLQTNEKYRKWYMDNFEWAVFENDMKWRQTERTRGKLTWEKADAALSILKANGKKLRGHTLLWAQPNRNPDWVQKITNSTVLYNVVMKRIDQVLQRYKGQFEQWDVNNEMLSNNLYRNMYGSNKIRYDMFKRARKLDPNAKLYLNDYRVVSGVRTDQYVAQGKEFVRNAPVDGMGVQCHFQEKPNGPIIINRLNKLAQVGLPIMVTEYDYADTDVQNRAQGLENAMRAFFSHKSVKGVLLWGFWDGKFYRENAALVDGADFKVNAAGKVWQRLLKEWTSNEKYQLDLRQGGKKTTRIYHGDYELIVKDGSKVLKKANITVSSSKPSANLTINV